MVTLAQLTQDGGPPALHFGIDRISCSCTSQILFHFLQLTCPGRKWCWEVGASSSLRSRESLPHFGIQTESSDQCPTVHKQQSRLLGGPSKSPFRNHFPNFPA